MKEIIILIILGLVIVVLIVMAAIGGWHYETGSGKQVGYVSAVEKSGLFFKTGRAYIKPELESTQEDIYCVIDDVLYSKLEQASREKTRVEVSHISWLVAGAKNCNVEKGIIVEVINL